MQKNEILNWIKQVYNIEPDYPWAGDGSAVFRHHDNKKWFALIMNIPANKLKIKSEKKVDILNVKCDPLFIHILQQQKGIFPAYHMNKWHWITILLDSTVKTDDIKALIDSSYTLTHKANNNKRPFDE